MPGAEVSVILHGNPCLGFGSMLFKMLVHVAEMTWLAVLETILKLVFFFELGVVGKKIQKTCQPIPQKQCRNTCHSVI